MRLAGMFRRLPDRRAWLSRELRGALWLFGLWWLQALSLGAQTPQPAAPREPWMDLPAASTGLAVGQKIPPFRAPDQNGKMQDFNSLRGPKGAAIYFVRSADW